MADPTKKTPPKAVNTDNLIEQLRDVGRGVAKTVKQDLVSGIATDALSSLFGTPKSGDLEPNQPLNLGETPPPPMPEMPFPYRMRQVEQPRPMFNMEAMNRLRAQEAQVAQKIDEIRLELKALIATLKQVDSEIVKAVDEQLIDPGLYHLNFLDRIKTILKLLRQNLNDSSSWLSVMRSRKKQRTYWSLYKKKGTEFGLNPDRVVSTQVG
ncbi:MAG: hypothetical protein UV61_C0004G0053 [Candidatus Gottesmanbacteria bacterium GW2011_GWB1_43_11]|uniref:DUF5660 domain-containing protein n=1 Tax=Candidatus Gottesmanbacteria bacterium GW2011_GWB1_43_11 TaxID=1618446 RepID=A0A0G1CNS7_9BACT|nr:MAG: hypothetical protein UV04_C0007G0054 [Candidatus Gottesmanbacteria bacterium GW2011_GWA2_42_16]KKS55636.1 MAG: hypothetical protein UV17_C0009G0017 [Candidatus Gottesmanbacteria bacterium GW2011_GWA1_42_26]KKS82229.1 MAG: hypothetical protein UV55_C0004G0045 [Candidatus Gottesmanbacteria bacterium GW2011_GWC1_43_10]KKS87127.1 MAG: hypothetical protein UV61_C0004G0053 [Candidatus Gottesmanbacteria bacterium GW2011_GWB1_43_11]OGG07613.1 MAG: hypothetical protein A2699_02155 [Candidatus Go